MNENGLSDDVTETRIWRPKVVSLDGQQLHEESDTRTSTYTKTYLTSDQLDTPLANLNRRILTSSQSFNNCPKPFTSLRSSGEPVRVSTSNQLRSTGPLSNGTDSSGQQSQQRVEMDSNPLGTPSARLVHKQYNSPLDLYSMNSIRKTIEAHSEMIAPGVKGVNFLKAETPVNKNSEVYKLVMEEEQNRGGKDGYSTPTCSQPRQTAPNRSPVIGVSHSVDSSRYHQQQLDRNQSPVPNKMINQPQSLDLSEIRTTSRKKLPVCLSCGGYIKGVFAKIQDQFIHPNCFNCTTCGASLKNTGYYTVNEKLYCELHARQVAKMHSANINLHSQQTVPNDHEHDQSNNMTCGRRIEQESSQQPKYTQPTKTMQKVSPAQCNRQTTISTMFESLMPPKGYGSSYGSINNSTSQQTSNHLVYGESNKLTSSSATTISDRNMENPTQVVHGCNKCSTNVSPVCCHCSKAIQGAYISAGKSIWCKQCSHTNFVCTNCRRSLLEVGFIEEPGNQFFCQVCYQNLYAPTCSRCSGKVIGECLNALGKKWHPNCFVCGHCRQPFGNSSFYLEDNVPYCEPDWNKLFTTKCFSCSYPIGAGDKWIEALNRNYHSDCFRCTSCRATLEGTVFYCKNGKPYCRLHHS